MSRACDVCRRRRTRCDGAVPVCGPCTRRGWDCAYADEDRRKFGDELSDLRSRLTQLENLIASNAGQRSSNIPAPNSATIPVPAPAPAPIPLILPTQPIQFPPQPSEDTSANNISVSPTNTFAQTNEAPIINLESYPTDFQDLLFDPTASPSDLLHTSQSPEHAGRKRPWGETNAEPEPVRRLRGGEAFGQIDRPSRLVRRREGGVHHYGPISIWSQVSEEATAGPTREVPVRPGDWRSSLPPGLSIDEATHWHALERFAAYYAPWCMTADMPGFFKSLNTLGKEGTGAWRTTTYSPLLHCTALFIGLCLLRPHGWTSQKDVWALFQDHCVRLLHRESGNMTISSLLATNLWSSSMHFNSEVGYLYFGMTIAAVQTLGLNVNSALYVTQGDMTFEEQAARDTALWTVFLQDVLRAIGVGRSALMPNMSGTSLPPIIDAIDSEPWVLPSSLSVSATPALMRLNGVPSTRSTVLHWSARLGLILRAVIDTLYSAKTNNDHRSAPPPSLTRRLDSWQKQVPIADPTSRPLPHILIMHLFYNLVCIYLHRPFYRTNIPRASPSAERCDRAANNILSMLKLYDELHGVGNAPMTLIQVTFGAASVFLLKEVGNSSAANPMESQIQKIDDCIDIMRKLVMTWRAIEDALDALLRLRSEWLPTTDTSLHADGVAQATVAQNELEMPPLPDIDTFLATFDWTTFGGPTLSLS